MYQAIACVPVAMHLPSANQRPLLLRREHPGDPDTLGTLDEMCNRFIHGYDGLISKRY